ncbi:hypothetical protein BDA96_04G023000 [Sorghum bicolor]|uniref:DUF3615 domain-containing protein n=1 Tax=Sorghum bicolor TaxID=4558 RepID=A0A921R2D8_SORBI|nr:hypothetical protein BDA96_04G023000 [Sorghum bicolor]
MWRPASAPCAPPQLRRGRRCCFPGHGHGQHPGPSLASRGCGAGSSSDLIPTPSPSVIRWIANSSKCLNDKKRLGTSRDWLGIASLSRNACSTTTLCIRSGDEYEPAPGKVSQHPHFHNGICWTHGNFVARKKRSGCFSFLPAPRTLFFFELAYRNGFNGVVTCTALDEPVTEAYSVLGFPLWCSARRTGIFDFVCKTCYCRFDVPRPGMQKMFACGHNNVGKVCEMCYRRSHVLHPYPGEFAFGYHDPYHPYSAEC